MHMTPIIGRRDGYSIVGTRDSGAVDGQELLEMLLAKDQKYISVVNALHVAKGTFFFLTSEEMQQFCHRKWKINFLSSS